MPFHGYFGRAVPGMSYFLWHSLPMRVNVLARTLSLQILPYLFGKKPRKRTRPPWRQFFLARCLQKRERDVLIENCQKKDVIIPVITVNMTRRKKKEFNCFSKTPSYRLTDHPSPPVQCPLSSLFSSLIGIIRSGTSPPHFGYYNYFHLFEVPERTDGRKTERGRKSHAFL